MRGSADVGLFHYYEGTNFGSSIFFGQVTLPTYGYGIEAMRNPKKSGFWGGFSLSQHWTGYGNESYQIITSLPPLTQVQQNQQNSAYSNLYGDLYAGYQFPVGRSEKNRLAVYGFAGWRSMSIQFNGGTFTVNSCGATCTQISSGNLSGGGTESDQSIVVGAGMNFTAPVSSRWTFSTRLQVGTMPSVSIANNFIIPGTVQILKTTGTDGFAEIRFEDHVSSALNLSVGYKGQFAGVNRSGVNSQGIFYPGGGWSDNTLDVQAVYHY